MPLETPAKTYVDGDVAAILRPLGMHTFLSKNDLRRQVVVHLQEEDEYEELWEYVLAKGFVEQHRYKTASAGKYVSRVRLSTLGEEWLDEYEPLLRLEEEDSQAETSESDFGPVKPYEVSKLNMEPRYLSVFQALRKIKKEEINLNPDFQRAFVWDEIKQSRLIESILIRIPLPAFYLDATDQVNWSVVDGLQRLTTLNKFCREESFALQGLQFLEELEGLRFSELPAKYQVLIEDDTQLLFYNLMPGTPIEAKFTIFSRVNTGGMQLTPQEIRHALSQGPVTKLLKSLAAHPAFRQATQGVVESIRMADRELVLRALSFMHLGVKAYREYNELDAFLLASMKALNEESSVKLERLSKDFLDSLKKVHEIFRKYSYRKFVVRGGRRYPFNKALFETWVCAVRPYPIESLAEHRIEIMDKFAELVDTSPSFVRSISSSTGSASAVNARFAAIGKILADVVL